MARLVLSHAGVVLKTYELEKESISIGRRSGADIQLDDAVVSSQHARVFRVPSDYLEGHYDYWIEDLGSTNGTVVNDKKITQPVMLKNGDTVRIGRHRFTFDSGQGTGHEQTAIYLPDSD